jgi:K+-sensing histidine kinase KdpD
MTAINQMLQRTPVRSLKHPFLYFAAAGFVAVATILRFLLDPWLGDTLPYVTYFAAIVAAAWFGRLGPSLFSVVLSCIAALWFFIPPRNSFYVPSDDDYRRSWLNCM